MLKIHWNGIKANDRDKLQRCDYTLGIINDPRMISVYARDYTGFSSEVRKQFIVANDTHMPTDYFETDCFRVSPNHPLYAQFIDALEKGEARSNKRKT